MTRNETIERAPTHTDDYRIVRHGSLRWALTPIQRAAVQCLWEAWSRGKSAVHAGAIARYVASKSDYTLDVTEDETALFEFLNTSSLVVRAGQGFYWLVFVMAEKAVA